ncbi:MAG: hypothetical protein ACRD3W_01720, partial [Terriglobales bacterium]
KIAHAHVADLCKRSVVSHCSEKGDNPDRRYTLEGGTGAVTESLVTIKQNELGSTKRTRASIARMMKNLVNRQDDREALFASEASEIGIASDFSSDHDKLIGCLEIVTNHGTMEPLPQEIKVGEKIDVRGSVAAPFHFERITVAWEGKRSAQTGSDEADEALPYFPPLDYVAYQHHSDKDYSGTMTALRTVGVIAAIAGGVFMPPVALAAPLILMSGGMGTGEPKPASDIPVHGGVHEDGYDFNGHIPLSNGGKEGIYYVTVWASLGRGTMMFPVSRRAIIGNVGGEESVQGTIEDANDAKPKKGKHDK